MAAQVAETWRGDGDAVPRAVDLLAAEPWYWPPALSRPGSAAVTRCSGPINAHVSRMQSGSMRNRAADRARFRRPNVRIRRFDPKLRGVFVTARG